MTDRAAGSGRHRHRQRGNHSHPLSPGWFSLRSLVFCRGWGGLGEGDMWGPRGCVAPGPGGIPHPGRTQGSSWSSSFVPGREGCRESFPTPLPSQMRSPGAAWSRGNFGAKAIPKHREFPHPAGSPDPGKGGQGPALPQDSSQV